MAGGTLAGEVGEVLGHAEAARQDQRIKLAGLQFTHVEDLATGDACRLHQHVAAFVHHFAAQVVDHVVLRDVRRKALHLGAALVKAEQGEHAFVNFRAVVNATAGKDDSDFLVHGDLLINRLGLDVLAPRVSPNAPQVGICRRGAPQGLG